MVECTLTRTITLFVSSVSRFWGCRGREGREGRCLSGTRKPPRKAEASSAAGPSGPVKTQLGATVKPERAIEHEGWRRGATCSPPPSGDGVRS